jgi:DNA-binding transcriptional MerR regulator
MATPAYDPPVAEDPVEELTIDELGQRTGTTVRNIRAYQSRGLLPPPTIRGRTGYYGPDHLARLGMIQAMQGEGFRLDAIQRLLERPGGAPEQIFQFGRTLLSSFGEPVPEFATTDELMQRFGGAPLDPKLVRKAEKLGLVRRLDGERWEVRNPTLLAAGEALVEMGIPLSHALAVADSVERHTRAIARAYARLFLSDVVGGEIVTERSAEDWERVGQAFDRLRPLAMEAIHASFEQAMGELVEHHLKRLINR